MQVFQVFSGVCLGKLYALKENIHPAKISGAAHLHPPVHPKPFLLGALPFI
jgi:hypothetical protein